MTDLKRLRTLTEYGEVPAAQALLCEAKRRNTLDQDFDLAFSVLAEDFGVDFSNTGLPNCRWGKHYQKLWERKGWKVIAMIKSGDYSGYVTAFSYSPSENLFFVHGWEWGSCEACDYWESRFSESWRYHDEDPDPSFWGTDEEIQEEMFLHIQQSATSYSPYGLLKHREFILGGDDRRPGFTNLEADVLGYMFGLISQKPKPDDEYDYREARVYSRLVLFSPDMEQTAERRRLNAAVQDVNDQNQVSFNPFSDLLH